MRGVLWLLALLALAPIGFGATLTGTAYTQNLAVAQFAILTINTTPAQQLILEDGTYNLSVPPGTYLLKASLRQSGQRYEDEVLVRAVDDGTYAYDLILFRVETQDPSADVVDDPTTGLEFPEEAAADSSWRAFLLGGAVLLALVVLVFVASRRQWWVRGKGEPLASAKENATVAIPRSGTPGLPDDLAQVLAIVKAEGGRVNQKDVRQKLPYSEAKVSMMVADLESRGLVKRVKQGRANLIVLK